MTVESLKPITEAELLEQVKAAGISKGNDYNDDTILIWINHVKQDLLYAGVAADVLGSTLAVGCIAQGVDDIWVSHKGDYSEFFNKGADRLRSVVVKGAV
jgi:hypothetical protein